MSNQTIYQVSFFTSGEQWDSSFHKTLEGARQYLTDIGFVSSLLNERNTSLGLDELWFLLKDKTQTATIVSRSLRK